MTSATPTAPRPAAAAGPRPPPPPPPRPPGGAPPPACPARREPRRLPVVLAPDAPPLGLAPGEQRGEVPRDHVGVVVQPPPRDPDDAPAGDDELAVPRPVTLERLARAVGGDPVRR